ncbi:hypothetical protein DXA92_07380 [Agathobaculum butyriciproducens]|nr:hypothetical protein DXA94_04175 [Agathobaculum butyriciproducens]RGC61109.1 hypothetical protein DXA92_07380 [Agathobaculum butyriciproducens]
MTKSKSIVGICKRHYRMAIFVALCLSIMVCPAFAVTLDDSASNTLSDMFGKLNEAYMVIKGICIVAAAATIASLGYAFFCYGGSDSDKKISAAKSRVVHVIAACGVLFLLPTIMSNAKAVLKASDMTWNPSGGSSNHIIEPKEVPKYNEPAGDGSTAEGGQPGGSNSLLPDAYDGKGSSDNKPSSDKEQKMKEDNAAFYDCWKNKKLPDGKDSLLYRSYLKKWDLSYPTITLTGEEKEKEMKKDNPSYYQYWKSGKKPETLADYSRAPYKEFLNYWGVSVS